MIEFKLPSLGADMEWGELLEWQVKPGDRIKRGQIVAVVDTSKAAVELECWEEGTVYALVAQPNQRMEIGSVMALLLAEGEAPPATPPPIPPAKTAPAVTSPVTPPMPGPMAAAAANATRRKASPAARKRAAELGVDLDSMPPGTGAHGAISIEDVERSATATRRPPAIDRGEQMRRAIAAAMGRSKREIPHYYLSEPIPLKRAAQWLAAENAARPMAERLLMATLLLKAVAVALKRFPDFNGFYVDDRFKPATGIHVGVAISLRQGGLLAPAVHDVDTKTLDQLMRELGDLVQRARTGSLRSSELSDPSVTVTNLGDQGVESVHGVIHPPQVALIGFGRVAERVWPIDGAITVLPAVTASLSADHRVSDGHRGARLLMALSEALQHPEQL